MSSVYEDAYVTHQTIEKWYRSWYRFETGNVEDQARFGRPQEVYKTLFKDLIRKRPLENTKGLHKSISTVHDHLKKLSFSSRLNV